jgi:signal transduction histidine kinase
MTQRRSRLPGWLPGGISARGAADARLLSPSMRARVLSGLLRPTSPPLMLALVAGTLLIAAESAVVYLLKQVAPGNIFGVVFLLGVLVVATLWGFGLGVTMALASAVVYVNFHHLQAGGSIVAISARDWVAVTVFLVVALSAAALAGLARSRAAEAVERRRQVEASRDELSVLAEQQAALRRVATLVGRGASPADVFDAVADELARCLHVVNAGLLRYEPDGTGLVVAVRYEPGITTMPVTGERIPLGGDDVGALVLRTGRAARVDNHDDASGPEAARIRAGGIGSIVGVPINVDDRLWGAAIVGSTSPEPMPADTEARIADFADLVATAIANAATRAELQASRDELSALAEQQAALRRIATLVARRVSPSEVFSAVAVELARSLGGYHHAVLFRYESDGVGVLLAVGHGDPRDAAADEVLPPDVVEKLTKKYLGERFSLEGESVASTVLRTGRAARMVSYENAHGLIAKRFRALGIRTSVGAPISVDGCLWGAAIVGSVKAEPLPADTETRIADFTDLLATAIADSETRAELGVLAEQQAALRRVATLVARGVSPAEVFTAVATELAGVLGVQNASVWRYEAHDAATLLAAWDHRAAKGMPVGRQFSLEGDNIAATVLNTGHPARMDSHDNAAGPAAAQIREVGLRGGVGAPIVVDGRLWGVAVVGTSRPEPLPPDTEGRVGDFAELVATAIANAQTHAELTASRGRIVAAADDARRRIERDLHDGAQQRLVSLGLELRTAEAVVPPELHPLREQLARLVTSVAGVSKELQDLSRGIHPAILSKGGLGPALKALARRSAVPVELDVAVDRRLPESAEVAAYYLVAEALTNTAKHARASVVRVRVEIGAERLHLSIEDDGIGGADTGKGSGLIGLTDRVEAIGGQMTISSPPGSGTSLLVTIPVEVP